MFINKIWKFESYLKKKNNKVVHLFCRGFCICVVELIEFWARWS